MKKVFVSLAALVALAVPAAAAAATSHPNTAPKPSVSRDRVIAPKFTYYYAKSGYVFIRLQRTLPIPDNSFWAVGSMTLTVNGKSTVCVNNVPRPGVKSLVYWNPPNAGEYGPLQSSFSADCQVQASLTGTVRVRVHYSGGSYWTKKGRVFVQPARGHGVARHLS